MEKEDRLRSPALMRIRFFAVVVDAEFSELGHQPNEIQPAGVVTRANSGFWDVVPAPGNARLNPVNMKLWMLKSRVPHAHFELLEKSHLQQRRHGFSA